MSSTFQWVFEALKVVFLSVEVFVGVLQLVSVAFHLWNAVKD
jgi:hypothetical protein